MAAPFGFGFVPAGADCCSCEGTCPSPIVCTDGVTMPRLWSLDATTISAGAPCAPLAIRHTLIAAQHARYFCHNPPDPPEWHEYVFPSACTWLSVFPSRVVQIGTGTVTAPEGTLPSRILDAGGGTALPLCVPSRADSTTPIVTFRLIFGTATVEFWVQFWVPLGTVAGELVEVAEYKSGALTITSYDFLADSVTLNLIDNDTDWACTPPATLTLVPAGDSLLLRRVMCGDCDPAFGDGDFGILRASGTLDGVAFDLCMARAFDETDPESVPTWFGQTTAAITLTCGGKILSLTIYCDSTTEGEGPAWKIKIRNETDATEDIFDLEVTVDGDGNLDVLVSETVTAFCGLSLAFVAGISACVDAGLPFADCCTDPDGRAALCCLGDDDTIPAQGQIVPSAPGSCDNPMCSVSAEQWGWNYGNPTNTGGNLWAEDRWYWAGPIGVDLVGFHPTGYLSCGPSGWEAVVVDSNDDVLEVGTFEPGFTFCPTPSGTIAWGLATDTCCGGGAGTFKTQLG